MTELEKIKIFAEIVDCPAEEITAQTNLQDIPEWDSLSALNYIMYMLQTYNIKMSGAEVRAFKTVADVLNTLK